ncbi:hypothetical protein H920_11448 [Fukomys damarensis]|uniref:Uncharacterized protein n=1 Tax=Fukomys damarensis TaxID=885580 RepID=A0A091DWF6_FUKDA|nr:hypothetical protein H920_11448 [Fukomys damarensis]
MGSCVSGLEHLGLVARSSRRISEALGRRKLHCRMCSFLDDVYSYPCGKDSVLQKQMASSYSLNNHRQERIYGLYLSEQAATTITVSSWRRALHFSRVLLTIQCLTAVCQLTIYIGSEFLRSADMWADLSSLGIDLEWMGSCVSGLEHLGLVARSSRRISEALGRRKLHCRMCSFLDDVYSYPCGKDSVLQKQMASSYSLNNHRQERIYGLYLSEQAATTITVSSWRRALHFSRVLLTIQCLTAVCQLTTYIGSEFLRSADVGW